MFFLIIGKIVFSEKFSKEPKNQVSIFITWYKNPENLKFRKLENYEYLFFKKELQFIIRKTETLSSTKKNRISRSVWKIDNFHLVFRFFRLSSIFFQKPYGRNDFQWEISPTLKIFFELCAESKKIKIENLPWFFLKIWKYLYSKNSCNF